MKKQTIYVLVAILIVSIQNECAAQKIKLLKKTHLANYPSASSLEFYGDKLYVIGDDAPSVWILDNQHQIIDSILLFPSKEKRIDPAIKADLESSTIFTQNNKIYLVSLSSFSTDTRNKIIFFDLSGKEITTKIVEVNPKINVEELNIEGAASYNNQVILSNRANATHKNNSLIITSLNLETGINEINNKLITLRLPKTKMVVGISGLTYIKNKDLLVFSASTEDTPNAYTDGKIGGSYIGYIKNISGKLDDSSVKIDKLIPISKYLKEKVAQKIESITVEKIAGKRAVVHLAADNDNGESTLFKLSIRL
jgi:hypothetical protein